MLWRYEAISRPSPGVPGNDSGGSQTVTTADDRRNRMSGAILHGEVSAESAADARAALRSAGLRVLSVRPLQARRAASAAPSGPAQPRSPSEDADSSLLKSRSPSREQRTDSAHALGAFRDHLLAYLRRRRTQARADALDAIATLLDSGLPLLSALDTLTSADGSGDLNSTLRRALLAVREDLRSGLALPSALRGHPGWFDPVEIALIAAAESGGGLAPALRELADRHAMSAKLSQKLVGALTYPAIVAAIGVAVAIFLALRTLPQLTAVLVSAKLEVPALTQAVIAIGTFVARWSWAVILGAVGIAVVAAVARQLHLGAFVPAPIRGVLAIRGPKVVRRIAVGRVSMLLADLLRAGIPLVDALRLAAPSCRGLAAGLGSVLLDSANRIERGESFVESLSSKSAGNIADVSTRRTGVRAADHAVRVGWFDREFLQLVSVGEASGELAPMLDRIGRRYERRSTRQIDRLATILEPATIIVLAVFVGTVVVAAVLPLVKLQEVLR